MHDPLQDLDTMMHDLDASLRGNVSSNQLSTQFPDLDELPPELSIRVLSMLNATDLCLAACVWRNLASDEYLWHGYAIQF